MSNDMFLSGVTLEALCAVLATSIFVVECVVAEVNAGAAPSHDESA